MSMRTPVRSRTALAALAGVELRLLSREWATVVFAFVFPSLLMLILAGVFGTEPSAEYGGVTPADYYVADYLAVPLGAVALLGLPIMLASYAERGVLRRYAALGVPVGRVLTAQAAVSAVLVVLGAGVVLVVAAPVYGVPPVEDPMQVAAGFLLGSLTMLSVGGVVGLLAPTARAAQALGLLLFLPMWLLGAGGPPRAVMPETMARISDVLPLGRTAAAIREAWLGTGDIGDDLAVLGGWLALAGVTVLVLLRREVDR